MSASARPRPALAVAVAVLILASAVGVAPAAMSLPPDPATARSAETARYVESTRWLTGERPSAVVVGADSVVSVTRTDEVDRFDATGRLLGSFPLNFSSAFAMDVAPDGNLHVGDYGGSPSFVHVLTPGGSEVGRYAPPVGASSNFNPLGIEFMPDGSRFVVDVTGDVIHLFRPDGSWGGYFGGSGTGPGQFDGPDAIASSPDGSLFVVDGNNFRVQRFDAATGDFQGMWGQVGYAPGQFLSPVSIDVRPDGHVLVLDGVGAQQAMLSEFLPDGTFVSRTELPLTYGDSLAVDASGTIYVTGLLDYPQGGWGVLAIVPTAGPTPPTTTGSSSARIRGKRLDAIRSRSRARLRITCSAADTACAGKVTLKAGRRTVGRGAYAAKAGRADRVTLRLGSAARRLLRRHARVRVTVRLVATSGTGSSRKMKLTR